MITADTNWPNPQSSLFGARVIILPSMGKYAGRRYTRNALMTNVIHLFSGQRAIVYASIFAYALSEKEMLINDMSRKLIDDLSANALIKH